MKPTVAKYVCGRIDDVLNSKLAEVAKDYKLPDKKLSNEERFELVMSGDLDFREDFIEQGRCYKHTNIECIYDFSPYEHYNKFEDGYEEICKGLREHAQKVKDAVWLGNEDEAQAMLDAFTDCDPEDLC